MCRDGDGGRVGGRQPPLQVTYETFATEGLSVPIDEIARRAGVGAGTGFDLARVVPDAERDWLAAFEGLLTAAQRAGSVRADLDIADIKALLLGYQATLRYRADPAATARLAAMIHAGLQPPAS